MAAPAAAAAAAAVLDNQDTETDEQMEEQQEEDDPEALALELERALEEEEEEGGFDGGDGIWGQQKEEGEEEEEGGFDGGDGIWGQQKEEGEEGGGVEGNKRPALGDAGLKSDGPSPPPLPSAQYACGTPSPLAAILPDEVLLHIVACVGTAPTQLGRVCRRWENARVQVLRERHIQTLLAKIEDLPEPLAREIEEALFASMDRRVASPEYKAVLRRLLFNLKLAGGTNPSLRAQVLSGQLSPHQLVRLSPEEWLSEEARALRDEAGRAAHKRISLSEEEAQAQAGRVLSRAYQCNRCGQSRCWVRRWRRKPQVDRYRLLITCAGCGLEWDE